MHVGETVFKCGICICTLNRCAENTNCAKWGSAWLGYTGSKVPSCSMPMLFLFFEGSHVCPVIKACGFKVCELDWLIHFENEIMQCTDVEHSKVAKT